MEKVKSPTINKYHAGIMLGFMAHYTEFMDCFYNCPTASMKIEKFAGVVLYVMHTVGYSAPSQWIFKKLEKAVNNICMRCTNRPLEHFISNHHDVASGAAVSFMAKWIWDFIKTSSYCIREDSCEPGSMLDVLSQVRTQYCTSSYTQDGSTLCEQLFNESPLIVSAMSSLPVWWMYYKYGPTDAEEEESEESAENIPDENSNSQEQTTDDSCTAESSNSKETQDESVSQPTSTGGAESDPEQDTMVSKRTETESPTLELWKCKICHRAKFPADVETQKTIKVNLKEFICVPCTLEKRRQEEVTNNPEPSGSDNKSSSGGSGSKGGTGGSNEGITKEQNIHIQVCRSEARRKRELQIVATEIQNAVHLHMDEYVDEMLTCLCSKCKKLMREAKIYSRSGSCR